MLKRLVYTGALAALTILATAPFAAAQNADPNTAGPTRNQLQLRLSEPREGQQISGSTIRVSVDYNRTIFGAGSGTRFGEKNFPMPIFDVYVDNSLKQSIKGTEGNVATIENIPLGKHKIVVMAKNISGEVIDRTEVNVVNVEAVASSSTTTSSETTSSAAVAPAPAPPPSESSMAPPPAAPAPAPAPSTAYTAPSDNSASNTNLPATGSNAPATALLGLTLVAAGLWTARRPS
jgi:LPXTG-motif cell wall-anchored protein